MSSRRKAKQPLCALRQGRGSRHSQGGARHLAWLRFFALIAFCGLVAGLAAFFALTLGSGEPPSAPKAAIVDQLSLTFPNPAFVQQATSTLEEAGYTVGYYPGEKVTVDFYRDLATHHYEIVVLRAHSGRLRSSDGTLTDDVVLFTGEPYSRERYGEERKAEVLMKARYFVSDPPSYFFGIPANFVESRMKGDFEGATVILMGCDGLRSNRMAEAFVRKGAAAFIGWDAHVSADRTDTATERVLHHLLIEKQTPSEAVVQTMAEMGPDPSYGSNLVLYPAQAAASTDN